MSFVNQSRYVGDEAASFPVGKGTVSLLNHAISDDPAKHISNSIVGSHKSFFEHCHAVYEIDDNSGLAVFGDIPYCEGSVTMSAVALLAILIGQHAKRIQVLNHMILRYATIVRLMLL